MPSDTEPQDAAREPTPEAWAASRGLVLYGPNTIALFNENDRRIALALDAFAAQAVAAERARIFPPPHPRPEFAPPTERAEPATSDLERALAVAEEIIDYLMDAWARTIPAKMLHE